MKADIFINYLFPRKFIRIEMNRRILKLLDIYFRYTIEIILKLTRIAIFLAEKLAKVENWWVAHGLELRITGFGDQRFKYSSISFFYQTEFNMHL